MSNFILTAEHLARNSKMIIDEEKSRSGLVANPNDSAKNPSREDDTAPGQHSGTAAGGGSFHISRTSANGNKYQVGGDDIVNNINNGNDDDGNHSPASGRALTPSRMVAELRSGGKSRGGGGKGGVRDTLGSNREVVIGMSRGGSDTDSGDVDESNYFNDKFVDSEANAAKNRKTADEANARLKNAKAYKQEEKKSTNNNKSHNNKNSSSNNNNREKPLATQGSFNDEQNAILNRGGRPVSPNTASQQKRHDDELMAYAMRSSMLPDEGDLDSNVNNNRRGSESDDDNGRRRRRGVGDDDDDDVDDGDLSSQTRTSQQSRQVAFGDEFQMGIPLEENANKKSKRHNDATSSHGGSSANSSAHNDKAAQLSRIFRMIQGKDRDELLMKDVDDPNNSGNIDDMPIENAGNSVGTNLPGEEGRARRLHDPNNLATVADDLEECASDQDKIKRFFEEIGDNPFVATVVIEAQTQTMIWVNTFATFLFNLVETDMVGQDVCILMGPVPGRDNKSFHHRKLSQFLHKWSQQGAMPDSKIASGRVQELVACRFEGIKRVPFTAHMVVRPLRMSMRDAHTPPVAFVGFFRDYSPEKALKISLAMNRFTIANSTEAIIVLNTRGTIKDVNEACCELFGYDNDFLIQTEANIKLLMPEVIAKEHDRHLRAFRERMSTPGFDIRTSPIIGKERVLTARRADGAEFPIQLRVDFHIDQTRSGNDRLIGYIRDRRALIKASDFNLEVSKRLFPESIAKIVSQKTEMNLVETYRNIPVILIDMVGFTGLTRNLDNESVFELVNHMYKNVAEIASGFQVEVAKCTGDGVIAVCGIDEFDERKTRMDRAISFGLCVLRWAQENERPVRVGIGFGELGSAVFEISAGRPTWDIWSSAVTEAAHMEHHADRQTLQITANGYKATAEDELRRMFKPKDYPEPFKGMHMRLGDKRFFTYQTMPGLDHTTTLDITDKIKNAAMSRVYLKRENARELKEQQERRALTQG